MRLSYPRSFLSLLLIGFTIVAAPLLFALFSNSVAFERLATLSEETVHNSVKAAQASRALSAHIPVLERSARQYAVAGDATFLEAWRANRATFEGMVKALEAMPLSDAQRNGVAAIVKAEDAIRADVMRRGPTPELSIALAGDFVSSRKVHERLLPLLNQHGKLNSEIARLSEQDHRDGQQGSRSRGRRRRW